MSECKLIILPLSFLSHQNFLALYSFSNQQISASLKFLYRARYLLALIHGQNHPEMAIIDVREDFVFISVFFD